MAEGPSGSDDGYPYLLIPSFLSSRRAHCLMLQEVVPFIFQTLESRASAASRNSEARLPLSTTLWLCPRFSGLVQHCAMKNIALGKIHSNYWFEPYAFAQDRCVFKVLDPSAVHQAGCSARGLCLTSFVLGFGGQRQLNSTRHLDHAKPSATPQHPTSNAQ
ncbi:hypothetical protein OF83DRAFT_1168809 [Amylostereum chailletii]|nr:hypothetical protein OF83DRAFT_1168809 [Amylostereum chailletii]